MGTDEAVAVVGWHSVAFGSIGISMVNVMPGKHEGSVFGAKTIISFK